MKNFMIKFLCLILLCNLLSVKVYADDMPFVNAEAYIVIDADSGRIIASKNADKKMYMASTTKIMTAILAIEEYKNLNDIVCIPAKCTNIEGSSLYLIPNQKAKMIDLLYGVMLRSGNDAATSVAYFAGNKNVDNFVDKMNLKALKLGAYNTNFVNPHGLHDKNHYTTAYDLAIITKYALRNELFRKIAATKQYNNSENNFYFINKNKVVYQYKYGTGVKIGYTKVAGRCLVASAKKDEMELIVVVLNDSEWFRDSYKVFDYAFENYRKYNIVDEKQLMLIDDEKKPVLADSGFSYILTEEEKENISIKIIKTISHIENEINNKVYGFFNVCLKDKIIYTGKLNYQ
ncbi:D-alanyl-D-alanine carboxypeptidase [Sedimentibacter sp. zth1]|uniref:D-alanyl-D-alanine carboxypeptidase family protein n=1 Tax=Sedimentibacter sp. zth1 TaxID=2816908 RepID=UPI001A919CC4|nr:D-alanyl-D-alanine carboxypeptidase family protein [Sedimentibacter sp. zth1]QSX06799.1 D-alanyl-D-alanine carboxypeptidase [Sedimentibacter sp. zth1]